MKISAANSTNYIRVLREIWLNEGISRIEISERLGLDKSTITNITAVLSRRKMILETAEGRAGPQGGRRPRQLTINKNYRAAAGIEVQPEYCNVAAVNLSGEILFSRKIESDIDAYSFGDVFMRITAVLKEELGDGMLAGIGLGLSGIVNPDSGTIAASIPLGVESEYMIADKLSAVTDVPVFIENDGNCCCWGELIFNRSEQLRDFLFCLIETREHHVSSVNYSGLAVGLGIVIDGKVHHGQNYAAGEFRSVFADEGGSSQFSIAEEQQHNVTADPELFDRFSDELGSNLSMLLNTLAMQNCFIGGNFGTGNDRVAEALKKKLDANWSYPGPSACRVRASSLGENAVAYGAAAMIIDRLFRIPEIGARDSAALNIFME